MLHLTIWEKVSKEEGKQTRLERLAGFGFFRVERSSLSQQSGDGSKCSVVTREWSM